MLRRFTVLFLTLTLIFGSGIISPAEAEARSKKRQIKKVHKAKKKTARKKRRSTRKKSRPHTPSAQKRYIKNSVQILQSYCPEYASIKGMDDYENFLEEYGDEGASFENYVELTDYEACGLPFGDEGDEDFSEFDESDSFSKALIFSSLYLPSRPLVEYRERGGYDSTSIFADELAQYKLIAIINEWLGVRYRYGGRSKSGIDCSNFTSVVVGEILGKRFPAGASNQSKMFEPLHSLEELQFGDLIFFSGSSRSSHIGHVGIYIDNGVFAHSSSYKRRGVVYTHISQGRYLDRFRFGGRFHNSKWQAELL